MSRQGGGDLLVQYLVVMTGNNPWSPPAVRHRGPSLERPGRDTTLARLGGKESDVYSFVGGPRVRVWCRWVPGSDLLGVRGP